MSKDIFSIIVLILEEKHQDLKGFFFCDSSKIRCTSSEGAWGVGGGGVLKGETKTSWGGCGAVLMQTVGSF